MTTSSAQTVTDQWAIAMERYIVDPASRDDPYEMFSALRRSDPIHRCRTGAWVFTRFDDVDAVLRDPRWSRWEAARHEYGDPTLEDDEEAARALDIQRRMLINRDDPDHRRLRRLVSQAFTPRAAENWTPRIRDVAQRLTDSLRDRDEFDMLADVGFPLPEIVICELLGVPHEDHVLWKDWIDKVVRANRMDQVSEEELQSVRAAGISLTTYFEELCERRRRDPRPDLVTTLVQAHSDGERLTADELVGALINLIAGGHETTANLVGNGMACLLRYPDQYRLLRKDPSLVPRAVEEMLRFEGPARFPLPRRATEDIQIRDTVIPAGSIGLPLANAANRDPAVCDRPDVFDITRQDTRHIAFGIGAHYCLGAALARLEATYMFEAIIRELPELELAEPPRWKATFLRCLEELKVGKRG